MFQEVGRDDADLQYGGSTFELASGAVRQFFNTSKPERYRAAARDPRGVWALTAVLAGLPRLRVSLTDTAAGGALRGHLNVRRRGVTYNRVAQGVLTLPPTFAEYLSGRSRQAVRTNTRRARALGIECHRVNPAEEGRALLQRWPADWQPWLDWHPTTEQWISTLPPEADWWFALDGDRTPLALAVIIIDVEWALLRALVSRSYSARWLVHTRLLDTLCERGVRHMCVHNGNALRLSPQLQYFQRLLGYHVGHLSLDS
ncbi:MAG TPA: hypothetical protein VI296_03700 [Candidatus Dormibacteraeota bacterium]